MNMPDENSPVTAGQIDLAINLNKFPGATPDKNWHYGQFEPWAMKFGYPEGRPLYGSVKYKGESCHIYFLNSRWKQQVPPGEATGEPMPVILKSNENPATYSITPDN